MTLVEDRFEPEPPRHRFRECAQCHTRLSFIRALLHGLCTRCAWRMRLS